MSAEPAPPPPDAVALYIRWQAARKLREELEATLPPAGYTDVGGIVTPQRDQQLIDAGRAEIETSLAFHRHPWWYGTQDRVRADRAIEAAARAHLEKQGPGPDADEP